MAAGAKAEQSRNNEPSNEEKPLPAINIWQQIGAERDDATFERRFFGRRRRRRFRHLQLTLAQHRRR